jgi:hypothetical protein
MRKRRAAEDFGLSFLDCICCGFGAIILLFVISMGSINPVIQGMKMTLEEIIDQRLAMLADFRSSKENLSTDLSSLKVVEKTTQQKVDEMLSMLADLQAQIQQAKAGKDALIVDVEQEKTEIAAMQKKEEIPQIDTSHPIGIPVESNYIAFVIDTSGSMRNQNTAYMLPIVIKKVEETLASYPIVKGIQVFDANGNYVMGRSSFRKWIPDSPEVRRQIGRRLFRYPVPSQSNPVPGIIKAIRHLYKAEDPEMKMGIYVFGDEFTGKADSVLRRMDNLNPENEDGERGVTINAIGFPNVINTSYSMGQTGLRFANLMRELTYEHGGAFIVVAD